MRLPPANVLVPSAFGCLLRLYEVFGLENAPSHGLQSLSQLWSLLPYAIAVALAFAPGMQAAAAGFATACLLADLYAHHALFRGPGTDSLLVVFLPLWHLLVIGPAGALMAWLLARRRGSRSA